MNTKQLSQPSLPQLTTYSLPGMYGGGRKRGIPRQNHKREKLSWGWKLKV
jgi:hypothetical protein